MKRELVGITLAMSIALDAAALAGSPASLSKPVVFQAPQSMADQLQTIQPIPPNPVELIDLQSLAFSTEADTISDDYRLLAMAKPVSRKKTPYASSGTGALNAGISNYKRGYIAKAIPLFEQATRQSPQNETAFLWLARAYQKQGKPADLEKSKAAFQKVLSINPNNAEALSSLGEMWSWDPAMRGEAIGLLKHAYELNPNDASISKKLAEALLWQGNAMDALRYAAPIANLYRNDKKWMREYAQMLSATGHADEALQIFNTVLKDEGARSISLKLDEARALHQSGQTQKAQALYEEVCRTVEGTAQTKDSSFIQSMASLAFDLGLYNDSLKWDHSLPEGAKRQKDVQMRQARALQRASRVPEAIEFFNRLYEADLLTVEERLEFADYLRQLHLPPESLPSPNLMEKLYQEAAVQSPDNPEVSLRLARYYAEENDRFMDALKAYQQALSSPALQNRESAQKEYLDFIKSDKTQPAVVEGLFKEMLTASPNDVQTKLAYAEYLSWQKDRRTEAMRMYVELANTDAENRDVWQGRIEEVLKWHQPTTTLIPLYQDILNLFPQNKVVWLTVARAYRNDKNYYTEAVETYSKLVKKFPDDSTIKREWLGLLLSDTAHRRSNIAMLKKMTEDDPTDLDVLATYGKLLSYEHRYAQAMDAFDTVLAKDPDHREALLGKGYVTLWSGKKLEAKEYFQDLRTRFPDDVDIAIGLAQTEKLIGRYDAAMKIIQEIKPLMDQQGRRLPAEAGDAFDLRSDFIPVANLETDHQPYQGRPAIYDFSVQPVDNASPEVSSPSEAGGPVNTLMLEQPAEAEPAANAEIKEIQSEIDALAGAVESLKLLQKSSRSQLDQLDKTIRSTRDAVPYEMSLQPQDGGQTQMAGVGASGGYSVNLGGTSSGSGTRAASIGEGAMTQAYGNYAALDYDTNPLLSGLGRFRNDDLSDLEKGLINELRPMLRGGFQFSRQDGEATTTRISSWGFPNQLSFSLTPQIRMRGGIRPTRYYLPDGVPPSSTWGVEYGMGATIKYWDRLTLDGDIAITHFTQSKSENVTFQTQAQYDFNDAIRAKIGFSRLPQYNSLLAIAGQVPNRGAFRGELVGQARENSVYAELNLHPFSQNWDWNLGYSWAFIDGTQIPRNYKNQAFTSLGYTWHYSSNHRMRLGYEFLYFGYNKNATNGFFDTTSRGFTQPVATLDPVTLANSAYVFGGYYSPTLFIMNAGRLDFRGSLFNKFLEYKIGGSLGAQTVKLGHGIRESSGTSLSSAFDANIIMNLTDWLAAYGDVDFLDAGGQFNRWRFGGGLILRPHIDALSPVFGPKAAKPMASSSTPAASPP
jgi:tetratricopeptide (TPR) repeat protein